MIIIIACAKPCCCYTWPACRYLYLCCPAWQLVDCVSVLVEHVSRLINEDYYYFFTLGINDPDGFIISWKWAFLKERDQFGPKFQVQGVIPHQPLFLSENKMNRSFIWYTNSVSRLFRFVTMQAFDGRTDRQTDVDGNTVCMHSQLHGNKINSLCLYIFCLELLVILEVVQVEGAHSAAGTVRSRLSLKKAWLLFSLKATSAIKR